MYFDVLAGLILLAVFVLGTVTTLNIGALGLAAAFLLGTLWLGEDPATIAAGFPAAFVVLILGVTYLFSVANANGTVGWILGSVANSASGRSIGLPVGLFAAVTAVTALGAPAQAGVPLLSPIAIRLGRTIGLSPFVSGIVIILGVIGDSFSPLNILALVANGSLRSSDLPTHELSLFFASVATTVVIGFVVIAVSSTARREWASAAGSVSRPRVLQRVVASGSTLGTDSGCPIPGHGMVTVGPSLSSAVMHAALLDRACRVQLQAMTSGPLRHLVKPRGGGAEAINPMDREAVGRWLSISGPFGAIDEARLTSGAMRWHVGLRLEAAT